MNSAKIKRDRKQEIQPAKSNHYSVAIILQKAVKTILHFKFLTWNIIENLTTNYILFTAEINKFFYLDKLII